MWQKVELSRRALLAATSGAMLTGWNASRVLAQENQAFRFAFMTDMHVQPELNAADGFRQCLEHLNHVDPRPDFAITGGDLIMDALLVGIDRATLEWNLFQECLKRLELKVYNTLGNHDVVGWAAKSKVPETEHNYGKKMFADRVGEGKTYRSFDHNGWHFVLLDSIGQDHETKEYKGWIDEAQLEWLQDDLQKTGKQTPVILVTHIPFYSVWHQHLYGPETKLSPKSLVGNAFRFRQLLELYNVKLVLSGHGHIVEKIAFGKITYIQGGAVSGLWWRGPVHGTPEGYGIITCQPNGEFSYEFHDYGWKARKS